ncbi:MAG TPA: VWA domain-containing protein [Thermoanaerobaculia bacterium]|nr:VWA domain-containing protein [Thermoanaerobaculia bacterium]
MSPQRRRALKPPAALAVSLALSLLLLAPPPAHAQPDRTFEETTDVVEVQIPVNVYDRQGRPVRGLTAADFRVLDEGRPQEVVGFEVVDLDVLEPADHSRSAIEAAVPAAARRHFLLLFDLSFSSPASLIKARKAARELVLNELHPSDLVAVATFNLEHGPQLVVTFTPDRAQVARAIDTLGLPHLLGKAGLVDPLRFVIAPPADLEGAVQSSMTSEESDARKLLEVNTEAAVEQYLTIMGKQFDRMEKSFERGRISTWATALKGMAEALRSVDGRKHVVYFSEGFDGRLLLGRGADPSDPNLEIDQYYINIGAHHMVDTDDIYGNTPLQNEVGKMLGEFRKADCVIQAVDISGLSADFGAARRAAKVGQDALFYVANETGGELFEDANNLGKHLEGVLKRSAITYLVTIRPGGLKLNGDYHRLEVKAEVPRGTRVSHRAGYFAPRPFGDLHPLEKSLLASDAIAAAMPDDAIGLDVLAAPFRANEEAAYVPVIIEVNGEDLIEGHTGDTLSTEIYTYVSNAQGEMRDFFTQLITLDLSRGRQAMLDKGLKYYGHLDLAPGEYLVRVLVRNGDTGRTGVRSVALSVPSYSQAEPDLLPPLFLEPPNQWLLVREQRDSQYERTVVYPFTVNGEPFIPAAHPVLRPEEAADLVLVAYNLSPSDLSLNGRVMASDGQEMGAGQLELVERTVTGIHGLDRLLATFRPAGLEPGDYKLEVALQDPAKNVIRASSLAFTVVD